MLVIFGLASLAAGTNLFFSIHDLSAELIIANVHFSEARLFCGFLVLVGAFITFGTLFGTLQSVLLDGEKLIFSYRLKDNIYKAGDIKAIK